MKKVSYYLVIVVAIGVLFVSYWAYLKYFKADDVDRLLFTVERGHIQELVSERGEVSTEKDYDLEFPFSGIVEKIYVEEGQEVSNNDPLIKLETTDYNLELSRLYAQWSQAVAGVEGAQARLKQYEAALEGQEARLKDLEKGTGKEEINISLTNIENAENNLTDSKLELVNAESKAKRDMDSIIELSLDTLRSSTVSIEKIFRQNLKDIIYPISFPSGNTCQLQMISLASGNIESNCFIALREYEAQSKLVESLTTDKLDSAEFISNVSEVKRKMLNVRSFLSSLLLVVDATFKLEGSMQEVSDEELSVLKGLVTSSQSELEMSISQVTSQLESLQNQLVQNKSFIDIAQNQVNRAENALLSAEAEIDLKVAEAAPEIISAQESQVKQAQANISAQKAQIKQARANVSGVNAQISTVNEKVNKSTLYAFADMKVTEILVEEREVFRVGKPAISLSATVFKIFTDISELDIGRIRLADDYEVLITLDAFPDETFTGKVANIEAKEIDKDGDKYYRVNITLNDQDLHIRSGMSADLDIPVSDKKDDVLMIPEFVVYEKDEDDDKEYVKVLEKVGDDDVLVEVEVVSGVSDGEFIEIISGLSEGQTVVVSDE